MLVLIECQDRINFELTKKRRITKDGQHIEYWAADALEARFRKIYRAAGIKTSSHAGRRSYASKLIKHGLALEQVSILLGHAEIDVTADYIDVDRKRLREMYTVVL